MVCLGLNYEIYFGKSACIRNLNAETVIWGERTNEWANIEWEMKWETRWNGIVEANEWMSESENTHSSYFILKPFFRRCFFLCAADASAAFTLLRNVPLVFAQISFFRFLFLLFSLFKIFCFDAPCAPSHPHCSPPFRTLSLALSFSYLTQLHIFFFLLTSFVFAMNTSP